jgi:hypothetical protein
MGNKLTVNKAKAEVVMASAFCYEKMKNGKNARRKAALPSLPAAERLAGAATQKKPSPRGKEGDPVA